MGNFNEFMDPPVVLHKGGFCAIHQSEGVFGGFLPLNGINSVGAVVVAGDDDAAKEFFSAFILEVFFALLVQYVPGKQQGSKVSSLLSRTSSLVLQFITNL